MITEDIIKCPKCGFKRALIHWSSSDIVRWIACPKCRTYFDHDKEAPIVDTDIEGFWHHVEEDTCFKKHEERK